MVLVSHVAAMRYGDTPNQPRNITDRDLGARTSRSLNLAPTTGTQHWCTDRWNNIPQNLLASVLLCRRLLHSTGLLWGLKVLSRSLLCARHPSALLLKLC